jgi:hypothetical protein
MQYKTKSFHPVSQRSQLQFSIFLLVWKLVYHCKIKDIWEQQAKEKEQ